MVSRLTLVLITAVLLVSYLTGVEGCWHVVYALRHANVWHLLCNVGALWCVRPLWCEVVLGYVIGVIGSLVPNGYAESVGCSGAICGIMGLRWGKVVFLPEYRNGGNWLGLLKVVGCMLAMCVLPGVSWMLHVWCFVIGVVTRGCMSVRGRCMV